MSLKSLLNKVYALLSGRANTKQKDTTNTLTSPDLDSIYGMAAEGSDFDFGFVGLLNRRAAENIKRLESLYGPKI
jgi:hypothetical protein